MIFIFTPAINAAKRLTKFASKREEKTMAIFFFFKNFTKRQNALPANNLLKQKFGLRILRYKNEDVLNNTKFILDDFIERINKYNPS